MDTTLLIAFITTTLLFVVVPGLSVAFATAQAEARNKRRTGHCRWGCSWDSRSHYNSREQLNGADRTI